MIKSKKIKYTSEGKKVYVIGELNAKETIVQEIFVGAGGKESASGPHFIATVLHNAPLVSWYDKHIADLKRRHADLEKFVKEQRSKVSREARLAEARVKALKQVASASCKEALTTLEDFVAGRITHVLRNVEYGECRIAEFNSESTSPDYPDDIKLLSLFGRSDGTLQWKIHDYYDCSGGARTIIPARGLEEARKLARDHFACAVADWQTKKRPRPPIPESYKDIDGSVLKMDVPEDVAAYWSEQREADRARKIAELKRELTKLTAEQ